MKKYCLAIVLVALLALVGCAEHEHSWKEEVVKEATCGASGLKVYTCEVCEATREEEIPATGEHSYEWKTIKEADCVNDGSKHEVCSVCGAEGGTEVIKAAHKYDAAGAECTVCHNQKADIESAEARIGTKYYQTFKDAVFAAVNATEDDKKTVEVLKDKIALGNHLPVNGSITINANNCDFYSETSEHDIAIYTFKEDSKIASAADIREHGEDISIIVNNAKNLKVWGQLNASKEGDVINIELNNCHNEKLSSSSQDGEMVMLRGDLDKGSVAIKMNSCSVKGTDTAVHSVFAKEVSISNCTFEDCAVPVNLNYKQTGACNVLVENCEFIDCGEGGTSDIAEYSAPIRIVNKSSEPALVKIKGVSVNNTLSVLGDVLLVDSRTGETFKSLSASFEGNKTDLKVKVSVDGDLETVAAGASATLKVEVPTT